MNQYTKQTIRTLLLLAITLVLTTSLMADKKKKYAALVISKSLIGKLVAAECTNKLSASAALNCARKKVLKKGGVQERKHRVWDCKGYMAAAYTPRSSIGISFCHKTSRKAREAAIQACLKTGDAPCVPFFAKKD